MQFYGLLFKLNSLFQAFKDFLKDTTKRIFRSPADDRGPAGAHDGPAAAGGFPAAAGDGAAALSYDAAAALSYDAATALSHDAAAALSHDAAGVVLSHDDAAAALSHNNGAGNYAALRSSHLIITYMYVHIYMYTGCPTKMSDL